MGFFGRYTGNARGVTFIELMATLAILSILASGIMPLSVMTHKRAKEIELRRSLRLIRSALDEHKRMADEGLIAVELGATGYPESLEVLVEGVELKGPDPVRHKFLRRIPQDPMTEDGEWGLRSYADEPDSRTWGGQDVYDVYSRSEATALDGSRYAEW